MRILLTILLFTVAQPLFSQSVTPPPAIEVNQIGFYPLAPKCAVVTARTVRDVFFIVYVGTNSASWALKTDTVFVGRLGPVVASANSSLSTRFADFSSLRRPGLYRVVVPGFPPSAVFSIAPEVFSPVAAAALKGYYYQRSSMALKPTYAGKWSRPAGHPDDQVLVHASAADAKRPEGTVISAAGGWYDAGDYNKYVVNSGITMGTLFDAYEDFPGYFDTLHTNIPPVPGAAVAGIASQPGAATGSAMTGIPDILNEALYNLRWMLQMQDPNDGGVYHKCTNAVFDGMVMPGVTKAPRYVVQKGTAATLDFSAVTAQAARILGKFSTQLPGLADSCRKAAIAAWQWAQKYPDSVYDQNALNKRYQPAITTGAYSDNFFGDERFWAAAELLITTGDEQYAPVVRVSIAAPLALPSWAYVAMMGDYSLLRHAKELPASLSPAVDTMRTALLRMANNYVQLQTGTAFHTVMGASKSDFVWGSNSVAANQGMLLINAWLQQHSLTYLDAALGNLDYLLGRNATGYCFVTGLGSHSTLHPHHRPSIADGIVPPVPGLMAGGPNPGRQDHQTYTYLEPETSYLDQDQAYASNEIAINWNAPLVYLAGAVEALQYSVDYAQHLAPTQPNQPSLFAGPEAENSSNYRIGLYRSNFPVAGILSEQIVLEGDGEFQYRYSSNNSSSNSNSGNSTSGSGSIFDSAAGTYTIVKNKLILTYKPTHIDSTTLKTLGPNTDQRLRSFAALPRFFVISKKRLYRVDETGNVLRSAPGPSGDRRLGIIGSRKRKYYLRKIVKASFLALPPS
jgi:endoglucanase